MNELIKQFLVPAVLVAAATLFVQGVLGIVNTIQQIKAAKISGESNRINHVVLMLQLIDGLPLRVGQKALLKTYVVETQLPSELSKDFHKKIKEQLGLNQR